MPKAKSSAVLNPKSSRPKPPGVPNLSDLLTTLEKKNVPIDPACRRSSLVKIYKEYISKTTSDNSQQQSEPVGTSKSQQTLINGQPPVERVDPSVLDREKLKQLLKDAGITHRPRAHRKTLLTLYNQHLAQLASTSEPFSSKTPPNPAGVPQTNSTVPQTPTHPISAAVISQPLQDPPPPSPPDQVNQPPKRPIQTNSYTPRFKPADPSCLTTDRLRQLLKQARVSHRTNARHSTLAKLYGNHLAKHAQARSKALAPAAKKRSRIELPPSSTNINTNPHTTAAIASSNPVCSTPNQPPPLTPHNEPLSATCSRRAPSPPLGNLSNEAPPKIFESNGEPQGNVVRAQLQVDQPAPSVHALPPNRLTVSAELSPVDLTANDEAPPKGSEPSRVPSKVNQQTPHAPAEASIKNNHTLTGQLCPSHLCAILAAPVPYQLSCSQMKHILINHHVNVTCDDELSILEDYRLFLRLATSEPPLKTRRKNWKCTQKDRTQKRQRPRRRPRSITPIPHQTSSYLAAKGTLSTRQSTEECAEQYTPLQPSTTPSQPNDLELPNDMSTLSENANSYESSLCSTSNLAPVGSTTAPIIFTPVESCAAPILSHSTHVNLPPVSVDQPQDQQLSAKTCRDERETTSRQTNEGSFNPPRSHSLHQSLPSPPALQGSAQELQFPDDTHPHTPYEHEEALGSHHSNSEVPGLSDDQQVHLSFHETSPSSHQS
ncbi:hypothetical protein VP01_377g3, partial [Puccinia sorghi]